jgi:hypothetical protein
MSTAGPARSLSVGDDCPVCGRTITETCGGGLLAYCWWCVDRVEDGDREQREGDR